MNEVFNLLLLYADLYALQSKKNTHRSASITVNNQLITHIYNVIGTNLCLIEQWPMKAQDSFTCEEENKE